MQITFNLLPETILNIKDPSFPSNRNSVYRHKKETHIILKSVHS